jgi:hypothetical protein
MKARAVRRILTGAWAVVLVLALAPPAAADIVVEGSPGFIQSVEECFEKIQNTGGSAAACLDQLFGSGNTHVIKKSSKSNSAGPNDWGKAQDGTGTGSTINWDPSFTDDTGVGVPRDPCASLLHELVHACDFDKGTDDGTVGENGIIKAELKACTEENKYRKANGLRQRTKYGDKDLPPSTMAKAQTDSAPSDVTEVSHEVD